VNLPDRVQGSPAHFLKPRYDSHKHAKFQSSVATSNKEEGPVDGSALLATLGPERSLIILLGVVSSKLRTIQPYVF
jgi:hypothetical protein